MTTSDIDVDNCPEGCYACNRKEIEPFLAEHGIYALSLIKITEPPATLHLFEEVMPTCEICGTTFLIDWSKCDIDN